MQGKELYSTGEFAKKANVSIRTIHFYEKKGLIRPLKLQKTVTVIMENRNLRVCSES